MAGCMGYHKKTFMKVLHLLTNDNLGGAARAAYRQHEALIRFGVDSTMLVRHKHSDDDRVFVYTGKNDISSKVERTIRRAIIGRREKSSRSRGRGGLTDPRADLLRTYIKEIEQADVINIHKTEHFADIPSLLHSLPPSKPVVITVHDLSPITGGCDYPGDCRRFAESCGRCPKLASDNPNDLSREIFQLRKAAYGSRSKGSFAFAADSTWTHRMATASALTRDCRVETIHYGIDTGVYNPRLRQEARNALGIAMDEEVICFAAHNVTALHKGGIQLAEALGRIQGKKPIHLITMGAGHFKSPPRYRHRHLGKIESDELQAVIYRAADVFVIPSLEEAFGQTALEAVACGTVVAGFEVGGVVDIVKNGLNGQLVPKGDSSTLADAITRLLGDSTMRKHWSDMASDWVSDHFSYHRNASAYASLYEELMRASMK